MNEAVLLEVPKALHAAVVRLADIRSYLRRFVRLFLVQELTSRLAISFLKLSVYLKQWTHLT